MIFIVRYFANRAHSVFKCDTSCKYYGCCLSFCGNRGANVITTGKATGFFKILLFCIGLLLRIKDLSWLMNVQYMKLELGKGYRVKENINDLLFLFLVWCMEYSVSPVWFFPFKCLQCFLFPGFVALQLGFQVQTEPHQSTCTIDPVTTDKALKEITVQKWAQQEAEIAFFSDKDKPHRFVNCSFFFKPHRFSNFNFFSSWKRNG